jgi:predicted transposase/invertase (TIGR01784 family)
MELLKPTVDYVFKEVFGTEGGVDILLDFVNAVFTDSGLPRVSSLTLVNPFTRRTMLAERTAVLDIRAKTDAGVVLDIEVQVDPRTAMAKRSVFYVSVK